MPLAGHEYVIITKTLIQNELYVEKYTGKCKGMYAGGIDWLFVDIARVKTPYDVKHSRIFTKFDEYLELTEMNKISKKGKTARQQMEKRSLNMVLKRLVNEHFEW